MIRRQGRSNGQRFDAQHNVVTEALLFLGELDPETLGEALADATHYEPTPLGDLRRLLAALPHPPEGQHFVDIGAGMGRVLMLASLMPFARITGIELSGALCAIARENIQRWREVRPDLRCRDLRIVHADATAARLPKRDAVLYLYNPFGAATLERFCRRCEGEIAGSCTIVYHTPVHRAVLDGNERFHLVADLGFAAIYSRRTPYALPSMPRSFCP